jgi:hypothetical protein
MDRAIRAEDGLSQLRVSCVEAMRVIHAGRPLSAPAA